MASRRWFAQALGKLTATGASVSDFVDGRRSAPKPPPPVTTASSPGQIADLQQEYGAEMAPPPTRSAEEG
jgi:hypothetical protein